MLLLQKDYNGRETWKAMQAAIQLGIKYDWGTSKDYKKGMTPIGSVEFCESCLEWIVAPNYYPEFLSNFFHRKIEIITTLRSVKFDEDKFIKSTLKYKEYPAFTLKAGDELNTGSYFVSDVVQFTNEWRLYISAGKVLTYGWYDGINEDKELPEIKIEWPKDFCGAVDFGELASGEVALVESHDPYACGWYGEDHENYLRWLIEGWKYVEERVHRQRNRQVCNLSYL